MIKNIQLIKETATIDRVVGHYMTLKREGNNLKACCPFHTESTPSFVVSKTKNIATCFGACARSWSPIDFIMEHENLTFTEAIQKAATIVNERVEYDKNYSEAELQKEREKRQARESGYLCNQTALDHLIQNYPLPASDGTPAYLMLENRAYLATTIDVFPVVAYPKENVLSESCVKIGLSLDALMAQGLVRQKDERHYDLFKGRYLFAIRESSGKIAGFAGRKPSDAPPDSPKYINSPESETYQKDRLLFGLYENRKNIQANNHAYLVEGYTCAMTMYEHGHPAVGKCGTALSIKQAKLLKKYCDQVTIVCDYDTNQAALKATKKDIETMVEAGFIPQVFFVPKPTDGAEKEDMDSFIRRFGANAFDLLLAEENTRPQDGILWLIENLIDGRKTNLLIMEKAIDLAVSILKKLSAYQREIYTKKLCSSKYLNCSKSIIEEKLNLLELATAKVEKSEKGLTPAQERDLRKYQICIIKKDGGNVYAKMEEGSVVPLSNFIIEPVYHVYDKKDSVRRVLVINQHNQQFLLDLSTTVFTSPTQLSESVATCGNFLFLATCKRSDYINIVRKVYDQCDTVYKVTTLGAHPAGFYTWANGITLPDGSFAPVTQNGAINYEGKNYVLPGYENINILSDQDEESGINQHLKTFKYIPGDTITIQDWVEKMMLVYGDINGSIAVAFYFVSIFRDILYPARFATMPILNLFGPPQRGKSTLMWTLSSMFGKGTMPANINNLTAAGLSAKQEQTKNAIVLIDEYKNDLMPWVIEMLKSQSDGLGRLKRSGENTKTTEQTIVKNLVVLAGQDLPTKDIALLTRCVLLLFEGYNTTPEAATTLRDLQNTEKTGKLSQITSHLHKYRETIDTWFDRQFDQDVSLLRNAMPDFRENRVINHHAILLTVSQIINHYCLQDKQYIETLKFSLVHCMRRQANYLVNEDPSADFFRRLMSMIASREISHTVHILVEETDRVTLYDPKEKKDIETTKGTFTEVHRLLYISLDMILTPYQNSVRRSTGSNGMTKNQLETYLAQNTAYLGTKKAKRFSRKSGIRTVVVMDLGAVLPDGSLEGGLAEQGIILPTSKVAVSEETEPELTEDTPTPITTLPQNQIPF